MKTIKQIREEYDNLFLNQIDGMSEEIVLEGVKPISTASPIPSSREMPVMLVFRRIQYRIFPNKQVVALYYSKMINKYLSIPFGPDGNVNLSEAVIVEPEMLDEDWQKVNRRDKTSGLSQAAVNAYRRENPGSKLQTAVTEKNPSGKRAKRRLSFCRRMKGMKKRLTSAKTARDPDSNINKALRRWNCEESFYQKLQEKRIQQNEDLLDIATFAPGGLGNIASAASAVRNVARGKYKDAALDALGTIDPTKTLGGGLSGVAKGVRMAGGAAKIGQNLSRAATKIGGKTGARFARATGKTGRFAGQVGKYALKSALKSSLKSGSSDQQSQQSPTQYLGSQKHQSIPIKKGSSTTSSSEVSPTYSSRLRQAELAKTKMQENKVSDIRKMLNEGTKFIDLDINGKTVTLNNNMAKRIVEVYDSVNNKNKKIVESMLNENLESFKRLLNFSIKV